MNGTDNSTGAGPKAYLNYLVFDRDFNFIATQSGYRRLSDVPKEDGQNIAHEKLSASITIAQAGYVYIYLSNEETTPVEVFFDDFTVTQTKSPVVQSDNYYPFGLRFNSYSRENAVPNKTRLFQGQEHIDDLGLNWDSFKWRNHQPDIGRFFNVDKLAEKYYYNSPYAFSENRVVDGRELEGLEYFGVNTEGAASIGAATGSSQYSSKQISEIRNGETGGLNRGGPPAVKLMLSSYLPALAPEVSIPIMVTEITGAPVTPSPQAMATVAPEIAAMEVPEASAPSGVNLIVKGMAKWSESENAAAASKAEAITNNPNAEVTKNPVARDPRLRSKFIKDGGVVNQGEQVDHILDLQLGGINAKSNLQGLSGSVNASFGKQIQNRIKNLPDATRVEKVTFIPYKKN